MKITKLLLLIIPLFGHELIAQNFDNYVVRQYSVEDGLPHNHIKGIAKDREGFLWIATWDGLSRYDGNEFKNYFSDPTDSTSLPYFELYDVFVDILDNVWVYSRFLSKYNRATDNFKNYYLKNGYNCFTVTDSGLIWNILDKKTVRKIDIQTSNATEYKTSTSFNELDQIGLLQVKGRKFYLNEYPLRFNEFEIDEKSHIIKLINQYSYENQFQENQFPSLGFSLKYKVLPNKNNDFLLFSNFGLFIQTKNENTIKLIHSIEDIDPVYFDDLQWFHNINNTTFTFLNDQSIILRSQPVKYSESMHTETSGLVWMGGFTENKESAGLLEFIPITSFFRHHLLRHENMEQFSVFAVTKDHLGSIWIGGKGMNYNYIIDKEDHVNKVNYTKVTARLDFHQIRTFLETGDSQMWIGYFRDQFRQYNFKTNEFYEVELKNDHGVKQEIFGSKLLSKIDSTHLIIANDQFLYRINVSTFVIEKSTPHKDAFSILIDADHSIWAGQTFGKVLHYSPDLIFLGSFECGQSNIESICQGDSGILWMGSLGEGLFRFDPSTGKSKSYTTKDGLVNNTLYNVLKDRKGNIWMSTNHGISMFNPKTETFRNFGLNDGLQIDEFNADAAFHAPDGEMFFGGVGGVVRFYPDSLPDLASDTLAKLLITDIKVSGEQRFYDLPLYQLGSIHLLKGDNNFKLSFTCTDFRFADKIRYRFKLTGVDKNWILTDHKNRSINYAGLSPGNYTFLLEASDNLGNWTRKASLDIAIPAFYYKTWWFRILMIALISITLALFIYLRFRQISLNSRQMQQNLRLKALQGQMNPHFIFNSLNSINYFVSKSDTENANQYIADFAKLMRAILNNSTLDFIPLAKEIESIETYLKLEYIRFGDKFEYQLKVDESIEIESVEISPSMIQPFIENAIWHGVRYLENRKGFILINFTQLRPDHLVCIIEDDGIGRKLSELRKSPEQKMRKSKGIAIVSERMRIRNLMRKSNLSFYTEDLFHNQDESGTRVTIQVPAKI